MQAFLSGAVGRSVWKHVWCYSCGRTVDLTFTPLVHVKAVKRLSSFSGAMIGSPRNMLFFLTRGNLSRTGVHACSSALSSSVAAPAN